jgi:hypothetical protein
MVATWTYTVHDLLTNVLITELPLTGVGYSLVLNDAGQLRGSFKVDSRTAAKRRVKDPYDATLPCRRCIYALRDGVPQWGGIIWTRTYSKSSGVVQLQAGDWWTYFDHRKLLPLLTPPIDVQFEIANLSVTQTGVDQNALARYLVTLAQSHSGGNLNISLDAVTSGILRDRTWYGYELADVGQELRRLTAIVDGPDITFGVSPSPDANGRPVRIMRTGTPLLGQQGSAWVWETDGNITDYTWPSDGARYAKRVFAAGSGNEFAQPIAVAEDTSEARAAWPLMESETGYSSVTDPTVLQSHADSDQQLARLPVVLPRLVVRGDRSPRIGEWGVGDDGRVRIEDDWFPNGIDTTMRIMRADVTPATEDQDESVELTMAPLLDDVA